MERAVCNLANILIEKHDVTILSRDSVNKDSFFPLDVNVQIVHQGINIHNVSSLKKVKKYYDMYKSLKKIAQENSGAVFISTISTVNALITLLGKKVKKIGCEHFSYDSACRRQKILRRFAYPHLDSVVVLTKADYHKYFFINKDKLVVIPNSLSFQCLESSSCSEKRIIAVGRLAYQKGFDLLIDSAVLMKKSIPDWHIDIFGDGDQKEKLIQKILNLKLSDFISINEPTPNIKDEFLRSSIFIMSSRYEGLPMVLIETQCLGLPGVSFDCPTGPNEIIEDNETGFIVPLYNIVSLAEKTIELALDFEKRKRFGVQAKARINRFSSANIAEMWFTLLKKI